MDYVTLERLAEFICGDDSSFAPLYRTGSELTRFFQRAGISGYVHRNETRKWWTLDVLKSLNREQLYEVIKRLASPKEYSGDTDKVRLALKSLNDILKLEGINVSLNGAVPVITEGPVKFDLTEEQTEENELKPLPPPNFFNLGIEPSIAEILKSRWEEADKCVKAESYLAAIIIMGSLLEGMILSVMQRYPQTANQSANAPKDKNGKPKRFHEWSLSEMIEVAHAVGWIDLDVKYFSHALRIFRNLIHPYEQMVHQVFPDKDTCNICWLVVQATANDLARVLQTPSTVK